MSLTSSAGTPQPSLAWQFESSNVDYVTGLAPTTSVGPPTYNPSGKYGSSIVFNNTPGAAPGTYYLKYTTGISLSTASGFTVCAWLKPLSVGVSGNQAFLCIAGQNTYFIFQIDTGGTIIHLFGQNPYTVPNNITGGNFAVTQSVWIHAVMVFSGTSMTTYYNGTLKDSLSLVVSPVTFNALSLGNRSAINADASANCEIDDLRVYNTALTSTQVQSIYNQQGVPGRGALQNVVGSVKTALTGTPLFSQLSPAATSSAVGAFSLRAVNGTSVRAVQVRNGTTSATQDFYADRLGNLLTAPVVGQSLANWLGGATGYVTTWYDQSGRGNHSTQATTANQPIIQRATKGPGYSILFNGTTNYLTGMSYTVLNGTNYSFSLIERRNTNATTLTVISSGSAGADQGLHFQYLTPGTTVRFGQYSDDIDITPYPAYVSNEPLHYWTGTESSTTGRFLYEKGTLSVSNVLQTTLLTSTSGNFVVGRRFLSGLTYYYSGEIFEVIVYTSALGTSDITQIYNNQLSAYGT